MEIQNNISLSEYTTFKIGGLARYFFVAESSDDLIEAVKFAKSKKLSFYILGGGSNVLVSDKGFDGLVIKILNTRYEIRNTKIMAEAGTNLETLVAASVKSGLTGLEWAVGIPGTIGGAVKSQTSAFGCDILETVKSIKESDGVILSVELELKKGVQKKSEQLIQEYLRKKKKTQPLEYASAGCIFKNPQGQFSGQLIEKCGLKGKQIGQAMVSKKHANFIVNISNAKAEDIVMLIKLIKKSVKEKFNIDLEEEIQYLGF